MHHFKYIYLVLVLCCITTSTALLAQDEAPTKKTTKVKPAKKGNSPAAITVQLSGMSRTEKNALAQCPLHSKHMSWSDNYQADATDLKHSDDFPFAYQLNYRRYCNACTRVLEKEEKGLDAEDSQILSDNKGNVERCVIHNSNLTANPDQDKVDFEKNPQADMPHAKQYLLQNYCKTCTTIYKIHKK